MASMKMSEVVDKYISLRDLKAKMKKDFDEKLKPVADAMDQIEAVLLKTFEASGLDSVKTENGTAFVSTRTSASVSDKDLFKQFVQANDDNWVFADVRAAKANIEQYLQDQQELPPGIKWNSERVVSVRRA